ncbi:MAG TPA: DNA-directed RNA polymerase subunit alpha [candidate division Zixibacteria bacterium]|nr:DNA-directed RNA polymerase subunit alpha [candidate division Zixibacteria bacterium]MDD4918453.1 DNA-directed RNA polymerase subunit alpha [candidate division Zixibacteria bacterium]MDM7971780.1 DNA-directed RNA polymerase subunit alpha [candidate division Zixibacteria bacterium]HOD66687.1 DNA-directed RNA polymerase subunit alpha [candidate division Zixibacteria bacterium]HPC11073.1 DNA-directed RNA polymerase subunit alpha [candidate division Zixibacteria bacterium]
MKWKPLTMPKEVVNDQSSANENYARFIVEPLERGYGTTLGNSLRRVLLSSIQGAAVVSMRIRNVLHEFSSVEGVYEDVSDIVLNVKQIRVRMHADEMRTLTLRRHGKGKLTAGMFEQNPEVEILNPDQHICEITGDIDFEMEIDIDSGRSYNVAEQNKRADAPVGTIFVDSLFSPVIKVAYQVENTRVGQKTDFDRLIMEITTDGSITPEDALSYGAKLLKDHLQLFIHLDEEVMVEEEPQEDEETVRVRNLLRTRVDELELSVRSSNCLRAANIQTIRDLVTKTEPEMLKYRNFGRKSLNEISTLLEEMGLSFGMDVSKYDETQKQNVNA